MRRWRHGLGLGGVLLASYGGLRLITGTPVEGLQPLALWLVAAVVIHDGLVMPAVLGVGWVLGRVPPRARRFAQAGLIVSGMLVVVAAPLIHREDTQPPSKSLLLRDYGANLTVLLAMVASLSALGYLWSTLRRRVHDTDREQRIPESGSS